MGLLKAGIGAASGVLADSWREYFYCDSLDAGTLAVKGEKRTGGRSSNTRGEDNIISNGSIIAVNEGQFMIIVEQGAIVEACGEAGEFVFDASTEPSLFFGSAGEGLVDRLKASFERVGSRFTFGGDTGKDQRVYYFNTKEIMGNKYGTATPVPFRVVDTNIGLDVDISVRCNGEYSYRIVDPLMFYKNVCGNVECPIRATRSTRSLKVSCSRRCSRRLPRYLPWGCATRPCPRTPPTWPTRLTGCFLRSGARRAASRSRRLA